jgi:uncharacterized membrane protein YphA (DoxX/SURF4 family)
MNALTRLFLVLLRLAIGWHLLFEGVLKVRTHELGPTTSNVPFSSAPYLRESVGPIGQFFRQQAGDPDEEARAKLDLDKFAAGEPITQIPKALEEEWDAYFKRWSAYYELDEEQQKRADMILAQAKQEAIRWFQGKEGTKEISKSFAGVEAKVKRTPPERIAEYQARLAELREIQNQALPEFQRDVFKKKLAEKKAEIAATRTELLADLDAILKKPLGELLTPAQRSKPPFPEASIPRPRDWLPESWPASLSFVRGLLPPAAGSPMLHWMDWLVRVGLVCIGIGLLLGLCTRFSCVMGVVILALITLPYVPLPGLPDNPRFPGYYYVNQNIIEAMALLALATTASGRWIGLDGLFYVLRPSRYRTRVDGKPSANGAVGSRRMAETI